MSDLKHKTEDELVEIIKQGGRYRNRLMAELAVIERDASELKKRINNSAVRCGWAVRYLDGTADVSSI